MADLCSVVTYLDRELRSAEITDYAGAHNGLQLENAGQVTRILAAVDASLPVIEKAASHGPGSLLLVHHGLFWQGVERLTGPFYRKIRTAMDAGMAIYSSHLPLDLHPQWGNNACLARAIGLQGIEPFFEFKGQPVGVRGSWQGGRQTLHDALSQAVGGAVHLCPGGPEQVERVGIITGGAGAEVQAVARTGVDTFITGEGPHWSYGLAEELGVNLFYAGHYATETFGVKALAEALGAAFDCPWSFIDHPTGL